MAKSLLPSEFFKLQPELTILDLRSDKQFRSGNLADALNFPASNLSDLLASLPSGLEISSVCLLDEAGEFREICEAFPHGKYLDGGLKAWLDWQEEQFQEGPKLQVLGGMTGVGKTEWLHLLQENGEQVIDLEGIAGHKGSVFGNLEARPQAQNMLFRSRIFEMWMNFDRKRIVWIEEEGPFLGRNQVPEALYQSLLKANMVELELRFETRLDRVLQEYGAESPEAIRKAILKLQKRMGVAANQKALHHFENGNLRKSFRTLLHYYDRAYAQRRKEKHTGKMTSLDVTGTKTSILEQLLAVSK